MQQLASRGTALIGYSNARASVGPDRQRETGEEAAITGTCRLPLERIAAAWAL